IETHITSSARRLPRQLKKAMPAAINRQTTTSVQRLATSRAVVRRMDLLMAVRACRLASSRIWLSPVISGAGERGTSSIRRSVGTGGTSLTGGAGVATAGCRDEAVGPGAGVGPVSRRGVDDDRPDDSPRTRLISRAM